MSITVSYCRRCIDLAQQRILEYSTVRALGAAMTDAAMTDPSDKTPKGVNEVGWMSAWELNPLTRVNRDCSGALEFGEAGVNERGAQAVP